MKPPSRSSLTPVASSKRRRVSGVAENYIVCVGVGDEVLPLVQRASLDAPAAEASRTTAS